MPDNHNQQYGSYTGYYSKSYLPAYDGSLRDRPVVYFERTSLEQSTTKGEYLAKIVETREDNNQRGKDASFDQTVPQVHSPVKFDK